MSDFMGPAWQVSLPQSFDFVCVVSARLRDESEEVTRPPHVTVGTRLHGGRIPVGELRPKLTIPLDSTYCYCIHAAAAVGHGASRGLAQDEF